MKPIVFPILCAAGLFAADQLLAATMSWDPNDVWKKVPRSTPNDFWPPPPPELDLSAYRVLSGKGKGTVTASATGFPNEGPEKVFEKGGKFCLKGQTIWLQYQFNNDKKQKVTAYVITACEDHPDRDPKSWKLLGSNDGQAWEPLDAQTNQAFDEREVSRLFKIARPGEYNIYRLEITANHGGDCLQFAEWKLLGEKPPSAEKKK